jgi:DNA-binding NarL/FixJ family response regulator
MGAMPTVLIVDDNDGFRTRARTVLEKAGHQVVGEAAAGATALRTAAVKLPEIVLLDVMLPDMSGLDVAERLTVICPEATIVLISTREAADYGRRLKTSPARGFISKAELSERSLADVLI